MKKGEQLDESKREHFKKFFGVWVAALIFITGTFNDFFIRH